MFLQAVLLEYRINMATGTDKMLIVSVGTGQHEPQYNLDELSEVHRLDAAMLAIRSTMHGAEVYQDLLCRAFGDYANPPGSSEPLDSDLRSHVRETEDAPHLFTSQERKHFTYLRYNHKFTTIEKHGPESDEARYRAIYPKKELWALDAVKARYELNDIGTDYAERAVSRDSLPGGKLFDQPRQILDCDGNVTTLRYYREDDQDDGRKDVDDAEARALDPFPVVAQKPQTITLRDIANQTTVVSRADIANLQAIPMSLIPEGLLGGLTDDGCALADLFAYLSLGVSDPSCGV